MTIKQRLGAWLEQAGIFFSVMFYVLFSWHQWWSGVSPRLIRGSPEREAIHHAHLSIGATLFFFAVLFFLIWLFRPGSTLLEKLRKSFASGAATGVTLFGFFVFLAMLTGLAQAWAAGEHAAVFGVFDLPHFLNWPWGTSGYLHSSFSTISVALFSGMVFVFLYSHLTKYVKPGMAVALLIILHLLVNLPKPPSLHPIAAFGTYVMTPTYYFVALAIYCWSNNRRLVYWPIYGFFILFFMYLPYFAFKVLPPWHQKPAAEIVLVEAEQPLEKIRSAAEIFSDESQLAEAKEATSWCTQCHNSSPSATHLLGPNLDGIYNKQAGTVEGYGRSSSAMVDAGLNGVFWTRENLAEFLTRGQEFIPGNLMNQQTDLSDPERLGLAIDYLEYLSASDRPDLVEE